MDEKEKKNYEVAVLLKEEEAFATVLTLLKQHSAEVREEGGAKKVALAYPIKHTTQAHFGFFYVQALPHDIKQLEKDMQTTPAILRSLIITIPATRSTREDSPLRRPQFRRPLSAPSSEAKPQPMRKTLSNEAIEKKIEEILQ
jgi:ribosomal protein S6